MHKPAGIRGHSPYIQLGFAGFEAAYSQGLSVPRVAGYDSAVQPDEGILMTQYEYKVVPAPTRGERAKGVKGTPARFAHALTGVMNDLAADGWEYLRADTLPCEERSGLTGKSTTFQNMLVFRRAVESEAIAETDETPMIAAPQTPDAIAATAVASLTVDAPEGDAPKVIADTAEGNAPALGTANIKDTPKDNGVAAE